VSAARGGAGGGRLDGLDRVEIRSAEELGRWLEANHGRTGSVWVVTWKSGGGRPHVPWSAVVDEALCWGWIDSLPRRLDDDRSMVLLSPRRAGSGWSAVNKEKIARLEAEGRLRPPGIARIEAAKADGSWTLLDGAGALEVPDDLARALADVPGGSAAFEALPRSRRRPLLERIALAKRPETRARRVAEAVAAATG